MAELVARVDHNSEINWYAGGFSALQMVSRSIHPSGFSAAMDLNAGNRQGDGTLPKQR